MLGSEYTSKGRTFGRLHEEMTGLEMLGHIDAVFYEQPLDLGPAGGISNPEIHATLLGLAMHAESWADAMGCRIIRGVPMGTWRKHFLGKMKRGTKSADLKELAMQRCREIGYKPLKHDTAEAIGILDYATEVLNLSAPWHTPLQRAITAARG